MLTHIEKEMNEERHIMVRVPEEFHRDVKVKAAEEGRLISDVVRQFLRAWVSGDLPTPPPEKDDDE